MTARISSSGSGALTIAVPVGGTGGAPRFGFAGNPRTIPCSLTRGGDKLMILSDSGKLIIGQATPTTYKHLAEAQLLEEVGRGGQIWSTPLLYKGKLYAKGTEELNCYDLTAK